MPFSGVFTRSRGRGNADPLARLGVPHLKSLNLRALDFRVRPRQNPVVTKARLTTALLCVLYIAVACCFGLLHNHHAGDAQHHCVACAWLVNAVTDVPVAAVHALTEFIECQHPVRKSLVVVVAFFLPTSSRAPPFASA